ncbi:unnamed protein product [Clonostachys rhizophaga]|uniref:L-ornithine N(5)-monooxygenase [NAD(P)H] n=1 Tax=Clonostachys rhizophaga TaxID=160324 RepID=A0A9N9VHN6_9HYPO|nr:unnamed protein product [Clonostachys rhizophaga]
MSPHVTDDVPSSYRPVSNGVNGHTHHPTTAVVDGPINGTTNGNGVHHHKQKRQHRERSKHLVASDPASEHDLICVGFGPASLAIAVALHDAIEAGQRFRPDGSPPRVLFIEKQQTFEWHAGMLLPGAKMQISFIKDLATLRDPRSEFTFLNYVHRQGRLVDFTNLGTFLPAREEYEDYLRWAASFFEPLVQYSHEVVAVTPEKRAGNGNAVQTFKVEARNGQTGQTHFFHGRNVIFATGGQPSLPKSFPQKNPRVIHSSQYAKVVPHLLPKSSAPYRVAVIGAGQSAAEIFNNVQTLYPNSETWLVMRQEFLRPSDDSPFVNQVFNPEYVDEVFPRAAKHRNEFLYDARATNYGVVRLELIEHLYEKMYNQKRELGPNEQRWPHRVLGGRQISSMETRGDGGIELKVQRLADVLAEGSSAEEEVFHADLVIAATGYQRMSHVEMLRGAYDLLPRAQPSKIQEFKKGIQGWNVETEQGERNISVGRDYKVQFAPGAIAEGSGIWLQGCCEGTHGLSDTLLSVLATRSGEMVEHIFGKQ